MNKWEQFYIGVAKQASLLSTCKRLQVGALIVKDRRIISYGYNGTAPNMDNCCEENNVTKPEVIHAEANAILKVAQSTETTNGGIMYTTHSPCFECAKMIIASGITKFVYLHNYRDEGGLNLLKQANVIVEQYEQ